MSLTRYCTKCLGVYLIGGAILLMGAWFSVCGASGEISVLPKGIRHTRLIFGTVSAVETQFMGDGLLHTVGRFNQTMDSHFLKQWVPEFNEFANLLNGYAPYRAGDQVQLGSLELTGAMDLSYSAALLAYGMNSSWTLGVALPILRLQGDVRTHHVGTNNSQTVCEQVRGGGHTMTSEFEEACFRLQNADLVQEVANEMQRRDYEPLGSRNRYSLGDAQIFSVNEYFKTNLLGFFLYTTLNVPTGPKDDPRDLLDIPHMHQWGLQAKSHHDLKLHPRWKIGVAGGYHLKFPDRQTRRVPTASDDWIPGPERTETLQRNIGDELTVDLYSQYKFNDAFSVSLLGQRGWKGQDTFRGKNNWNYSFLEQNTEASWWRGQLEVAFSTVDWFLQKKFAIPFSVSYIYSDILSGVNIPRQLRNELSLMFFF